VIEASTGCSLEASGGIVTCQLCHNRLKMTATGGWRLPHDAAGMHSKAAGLPNYTLMVCAQGHCYASAACLKLGDTSERLITVADADGFLLGADGSAFGMAQGQWHWWWGMNGNINKCTRKACHTLPCFRTKSYRLNGCMCQCASRRLATALCV